MPSCQLRGLIGVITLAASAAAMAGSGWTAGKLIDMSATAACKGVYTTPLSARLADRTVTIWFDDDSQTGTLPT